MSRDPVHIRAVEIHRALGIRQGEGFALTDLEPGINLIFGPNGSGKSTTCQVVQELLWPGRLQRPTVSGIILDGVDEWRIDVDAGHTQSHRNGQSAALPDFGSRENRTRYLLGLKELIIDDSSDFARAIAEASQGGYDLDSAADVLGFRTRPKSRKSECDRVQEREHDVEEARRRQIHVEREAERLADLHGQLDAAHDAGRELDVLKKAREYHDAEGRCRDLRLEIDTYPEGVGRLQGDERKQLDALAEEERHLIGERTAEESRQREAQRELDDLKLPRDGVHDERLRELRAMKRSLRDAEVRIDEERRRRDEARGIAADALRRLGDHFTEEQLALIDSIDNVDLGEFARKTHRLHAMKDVLSERRRWLGQEEPEETQGLKEDELREGIAALTRWLASPTTPKGGWRPSWLSVAAMLLLVASAVGLAIAGMLVWVLAVLVAVAMLAVEWVRARRPSSAANTNPRDVFRASYLSLALPKPDGWDDETVFSLLRDLIRLNATMVLFEQRRAKLEQVRVDEDGFQHVRDELEQERKQLEAHLGVSIDIGDEWFPALVDRVREWHKATSQIAAADAALAGPEKERGDLVARINQSLSEYGYEAVQTSDAADEAIADLERRRNRHDSAQEALERSVERLEQSIVPGLEGVASRRAKIFLRLEIGEDQESVLDNWLARYPKYRDRQEALAKEDAICSDRATALADRTDLLELDSIEIDLQIQAHQATADKRDDLNQTIGEINRQIKDAKAGHVLSDALEQRDDALLALAEARDENRRAVAGAALADWVRREAVERSRPQVFERANDLFVRFTRGTLRLEMDDSAAPPAFVARRGSYPFQSLNELSDGERIQLMMAVRLAFLEQDEARRLPLLVDEVLGTSDDGRSGVLIDTLIDIAGQGRQVFYCTAQHDELGKWRARLRAMDVPFKVLDLGEIRNGAVHNTEPLEIAPFETSTPPAPDGLTYEEYGRVLGVPGPDPAAETIDAVHLWHVLDDADLLFELLCNGISTWGQLQTLIEHGGAGLVDARNGSFDRARAAAKAMRAACEAWRVGRGKAVDRSALLDSGCVSDRFVDELARLARRLDGDAAAIIRAIEGGAVSYWLTKNTERLREYFEEEGYLSLQTPLKPEDLRVRMYATVAEELRSGLLAPDFIERLVARLFGEQAAVREDV